MDVQLLRIDSRLVHGQVTTNWIRVLHIDRIIVVSNAVAADHMRRLLIEQAVPSHIYVNVVNEAKMFRLLKDDRFDHLKPLILVEDVHTARLLVENGLSVPKINIGSLSFSTGKTRITDSISVDAVDVNDFRWLHQQHIRLEAQKVSQDPVKDLWKVLVESSLVKESEDC